MTMRDQIESKLKTNFRPILLKTVDESCHHHLPKNIESHFRVIMVSDEFTRKRLLDRHRLVYHTLAELMTSSSFHSLGLHLYTAEEWKQLKDRKKLLPTVRKCFQTY